MALHGKLASAASSPLAASLRKVLGVGPDDEVEISGPQFERYASEPPPMEAPDSWAMFDHLKTLSREDLIAVGMRPWDKESGLWLFPGEWYESIPKGYPIVAIDGVTELFEPGGTDDDIRGGCLAYGIQPTPPERREEK